jgi:sec-independent protein translocase protein TatA
MLAAGPFGLGLPELLVILVVVVLIFGTSRVADIGGALGKSIREFRRAARDDEPESKSANAASSAPPSEPDGRKCTNCGKALADEAKFCANCGAPTQATVS